MKLNWILIVFAAVTLAPATAPAQLSLRDCEHEASATACYRTNFFICDDADSTYEFNAGCTVRDASASTSFFDHEGCGGQGTSLFETSHGSGTRITVSHSMLAAAYYVDTEPPVCLRASCSARGYSRVESELDFRRTAWFWFEGDITLDVGQNCGHGNGDRAVVVLSLPGSGSGFSFVADEQTTTQSWVEVGVIDAPGVVIFRNHAQIGAGADDDDCPLTYDSATSTAFADFLVVECLAD